MITEGLWKVVEEDDKTAWWIESEKGETVVGCGYEGEVTVGYEDAHHIVAIHNTRVAQTERKTREIGEITIKVNVDCSEALEQLAKLKEAMKRIRRDPAANRIRDELLIG